MYFARPSASRFGRKRSSGDNILLRNHSRRCMESNPNSNKSDFRSSGHKHVQLRQVLNKPNRFVLIIKSFKNELVAAAGIDIPHVQAESGRPTYDAHANLMLLIELSFECREFIKDRLDCVLGEVRRG